MIRKQENKIEGTPILKLAIVKRLCVKKIPKKFTKKIHPKSSLKRFTQKVHPKSSPKKIHQKKITKKFT